VPTAIVSAGDHAARRFLEFFAATIRNKNTRLAYYRAACNFFGWLEETASSSSSTSNRSTLPSM
jgi:hypothetical protein